MTFHHVFIYLFRLGLHFVPGLQSAVCSLQSAFCTDRNNDLNQVADQRFSLKHSVQYMSPYITYLPNNGLLRMLIIAWLAQKTRFRSLFCKVFQKCTMDLSCKTLIEVLVLNFEAMFAAVGKIRKKDFCIAFSGKQQKCCELAPLRPLLQ